MKSLFFSIWLGSCLIACGADYVIAISVDGLGSAYLQRLVEAGKLPHFAELIAESAGTPNARTDPDITVTLPNHADMITGRRTLQTEGHNWTRNTDPAKGMTIHSNKGCYVASVFDVAHDHGLRTGLWSTKSKFSLFRISYDDTHGAPDTTGPDNGRNKVDCFAVEKSPALADHFISAMSNHPCHFAFVHFGDPDAAGHTHGWGSEPYNASLSTIDGYLGRIMDLVATHPTLKGKTCLILTADHGGEGREHGDAAKPLDYIIPFHVWGAGVTHGDLYAMNAATRRTPGESRPTFDEPVQPIRNGEVGNLALSLLGLPPIPGSTINSKQDLKVKKSETASTPAGAACCDGARR
ncbi:MAG: alkaline phosphatase family protein [bacterium]